ncbi:hypothetical protein SSUR61_1628 [Streptococcus suis R61]|uniref:Uncharacterized protein n=1 Tax=Streptococcus suis R61 TaxID=996306 RepID=A0AA87F750_STRSU|nr:hypothetical protein SSUR61_1628 [Streptococcus suis R61]
MNSYTTAVLIYDLILPHFLKKSRENWQKMKTLSTFFLVLF